MCLASGHLCVAAYIALLLFGETQMLVMYQNRSPLGLFAAHLILTIMLCTM